MLMPVQRALVLRHTPSRTTSPRLLAKLWNVLRAPPATSPSRASRRPRTLCILADVPQVLPVDKSHMSPLLFRAHTFCFFGIWLSSAASTLEYIELQIYIVHWVDGQPLRGFALLLLVFDDLDVVFRDALENRQILAFGRGQDLFQVVRDVTLGKG
jgi:hypothetical protein